MADNLTQQADEVEALTAIYVDEWCVLDEASRSYCIAVTDGQEKPIWKVCLQVLLPADYPNDVAPLYQLNAPWLKDAERQILSDSLDYVCSENTGECVLYLLVERIREFLVDKLGEQHKPRAGAGSSQSEAEDLACAVSLAIQQADAAHIFDELPTFHHGDPITDRRSTFQAHLATPVVSQQQVRQVLAKLYENKKIGNASHNILAYRIYRESPSSTIQDCDDDGETNAGGRLLHLLQILDARNVIVVVSRWYGGILLGPDRFKHISNAARNVLQSAGFIPDKESSGSKGKAEKPKKSKIKYLDI